MKGRDRGRTLKDRLGPGREQAQQYARHGQRHDQRVDAEDGHAHAVGAARQQADRDAHHNGDQRAVGRLVGRHIGRTGGDHGDGEVDAAGEHEDRLRAGQNAQRRGLEQHVAHAALTDRKLGSIAPVTRMSTTSTPIRTSVGMFGHEESGTQPQVRLTLAFGFRCRPVLNGS